MDISGATSTMYVTHDDAATGTAMGLYTRNVTSGAEAFVGAYPAGMFIGDVSVFIQGGTPTPTGTPTVTSTATPILTSTNTPTATATSTPGGGGELIYGMTVAGLTSTVPGSNGVNLVRFNSSAPGTVTTVGPFTGLVSGHTMRSIDFRPANGQLYGLSTNTAGSAAQIYTINLMTAACTPVGTGLTLGTNAFTFIEMDFNPVADRIRIVTAGNGTVGNNNFRANPDTGALVAPGY